ncbi:MAG: hypothetical protein HY902_05110 [Deltaproteobacteria bacterium]|nr:hypothetical protein [Deltaproteobacteria bacterium]
MAPESLGIALACEDRLHWLAAHVLVAWQLQAAGSNYPLDMRTCPMRSHADGTPYTKLTSLDAVWAQVAAQKRLPRPHGWIRGKPLQPEADLFRKLAMLYHALGLPIAALVVVRDLDGCAERKAGFAQVKAGFPDLPFAMVLAAPQPEVEAWFVAGYRGPLADGRTLGLKFSPVRESERLTSRPNYAPTDAKRVFLQMFGGDEDAATVALTRVACDANAPAELRAFLAAVDAEVAGRLG